jgi:hypothetical protein
LAPWLPGDGQGDGWALGPRAPCQWCPAGTFKAESGDGFDLCRPCDPFTTDADDAAAALLAARNGFGDGGFGNGRGPSEEPLTAPLRDRCRCVRPPGGHPLAPGEALDFDFRLGGCRAVPAANASSAEAPASLAGTAAARWEERGCERGFWCEPGDGVRRPCAAGQYGSASRETSAACSGSYRWATKGCSLFH